MSDYVPKAGDPINTKDLDMIFEAIRDRQANFTEEPAAMSMVLVLLGIGDRFAPVTCIEQEWEGLKRDIPPGEGVPKCPNGHVLTQGPGLTLGWLQAE